MLPVLTYHFDLGIPFYPYIEGGLGVMYHNLQAMISEAASILPKWWAVAARILLTTIWPSIRLSFPTRLECQPV